MGAYARGLVLVVTLNEVAAMISARFAPKARAPSPDIIVYLCI